MYKLLDGTKKDVLAVELSGGYTQDDLEKLRAAFEKVTKKHDKVNLLIKIHDFSLKESECKALLDDSRYAIKHVDQMRHIAIVGHGSLLKMLTKLDNMIWGSVKKERIEKFFDESEIEEAWKFVRS